MKHLKLFESFDLVLSDVKDLLQDIIDEFNLHQFNESFQRPSIDTYQIKYNAINEIEVKIYVNYSTFKSIEFQSHLNDFSSRLRSMGYNICSYGDYRDCVICEKRILINNLYI